MRALTRLTLIVVVAVLAVRRPSRAADAAAEAPLFAGTAEEEELVELIAAAYKSYDAFYTEGEKITDRQAQTEFYEENDPAREFVSKLLEFEARQPGTDVGLMALRRVVLLAAGSGSADSAASVGRREALKRLPNYADRPILVEVLRYLDSGAAEPASADTLRLLADDEKADSAVRAFSKFFFARGAISRLRTFETLTRRLAKLKNGATSRVPDEEKILKEYLEPAGNLPQIQADQAAAIESLHAMAASNVAIRQPGVNGRDPNWYLIELDAERTKTAPRLAELAEGLIFQQSHLQIGTPAPELEVKLLSGEDWSLADERGKAVIIQFSFKGCGPCEAMYPDLRELQQLHADRLSILSIMADEHLADAEEGAASGKMTWNIHWDGQRGPLATRWAVTGFPTVYVVDTQGRIAEMNLRGDELRSEVARLLE